MGEGFLVKWRSFSECLDDFTRMSFDCCDVVMIFLCRGNRSFTREGGSSLAWL